MIIKREAILRILISACIIVVAAIIGYKIFFLEYSIEKIIPRESYSVDVSMNFEGYGDDIQVKTFLPKSEMTQDIESELNDSSGLNFRVEQTNHYKQGIWSQYKAKGSYVINYSFRAQIKPLRFRIDPQLYIPESYPESLSKYLEGTEVIQTDDPLIRNLTQQYQDPEGYLEATIKNIYDYVLSLGSRPFKGTTDAVTAAKLGEASCNGKSRLFIAMVRNNNIPARLVGGLILTPGSKRTSHQWIEVYIAGHWVPFDTLNDHYASLPDNYLILYRGDEVLFKHSANIAFDYRFSIVKRIVPDKNTQDFLSSHTFNLYNVLNSFSRLNISLNLLKIILMMPLGVLIVVISRNIIGIKTFGTFLPALMAVAVRETGLLPGILAFVIIIAITNLIRYPLEKLRIMHTPKLAIMMVGVVTSLIIITVLADLLKIEGIGSIGAATLFPIAILTITSERFAISVIEDGFKKTLFIMFQTLIVMGLCYGVMNSFALQILFLAFPELLLGLIALNLYIGSWIGVRVTELFRFRTLITEEPQ
jgi:transglutaminase-like putative cysteine protease